MAFCEECGREIPEGERLCPACDAQQQQSQGSWEPEGETPPPEPETGADRDAPEKNQSPEATETAPKPKAPGRTLAAAMGGLLALFLVFFGVALFFGDRGSSGPDTPSRTLETWQGTLGDQAPAADPGPDAIETVAPDAQSVLENTPPVHTYQIVVEDVSWQEANDRAQAAGGYLATITSQEEFEAICAQADQAAVATGVRYLWLGGRMGSAGWSGTDCWITGEDFTFAAWYPGEPSGQDEDGTPEDVLCMWNVENSGWSFNDQRNDLLTVLPEVSGKVGYVIEFEG